MSRAAGDDVRTVRAGREQLDDPGLGPCRWTVADAADQARTRPWSTTPRRGRSLGPARRRLDALRAG